MRHILPISVLIVWVLPAHSGRTSDPLPSGNFSGSLTFEHDRDAADELARAENELSSGNVAVGLRRLQNLLDRPHDALIERRGTYVSLWEAANRLIRTLSAENHRLYLRLVGDEAAQAWSSARRPANLASLARLTDRYRHTQVGRDAAFLMALLAFDRGESDTAAGWLAVLRSIVAVDVPPEAAELQQRLDQEAVASISESRQLPETKFWKHEFRVGLDGQRAIEGALGQLDAHAMTPLLTGQPLLQGGQIITRSLSGIECLDAETGKQFWNHPIPSDSARLAEDPGDLDNAFRNGQIAAVLLRSLVRDSLQTELAVDDRTVYTIITTRPASGVDSSRPVNSLRAIDLDTGETRWEVRAEERSRRRRRSRNRPSDAGSVARFFLGPPLVDDGSLTLLAQQGQTLELVTLDRQGRFVDAIPIGQTVRDLWPQRKSIENAAPGDRERQSTACRLSRQGHRVLCPTACGAVACVDSFRRRLLWAYRYPRTDLPEQATELGDATYFREMPVRDAFPTAWCWQTDELGICIAPEADRIFAFHMETGRLVWSRGRGDAVDIMKSPIGDPVLIGTSHVALLRIDSGIPRWQTSIRRPVGTSALVDGQLIIPVDEQVQEQIRFEDGSRLDTETVDDANLDVQSHPPTGLQMLRLRNLYALGGGLFCQTPESIAKVSADSPPADPGMVSIDSLLPLLSSLERWREDVALWVLLLRSADSRFVVADDLIIRLLEASGLRRSVEEQLTTLVQRVHFAVDAGHDPSVDRLQSELEAFDLAGFYVSSSAARYSARLDRWLDGITGRRPSETGDPEAGFGMRLSPEPVWPWPDSRPTVAEQKTSFGIPYFQRVPLLASDDSPWRSVTIEADRQGRVIQFHAPNEPRPVAISLPRESGNNRLEPEFLQAWAPDDRLVVRIGTELVAFRWEETGQLPAHTLWPGEGQTLSLLGPLPTMRTAMRQLSDEAIPPWKDTSSGFQDVFGREVAAVGPVCRGYLCYQQRGHLIALETGSGRQIWRHSRLPRGTRVVGDEKHVVLFHETDPRVRVLDPFDGRVVHEWSRPVDSDQSEAVFEPRLVSGALCLLTSDDAGAVDLKAIDMTTGQVAWHRKATEGAICFAAGPDQFGLVEPFGDDSSLRFISWTAGESADHIEVDVSSPEAAFSISDGRQRYVAVSGKITDLRMLNVKQIRGGLDRPLVNGQLLAFDVGSFRPVWSRPLRNVGFPTTQPRHVPILILNDLVQAADEQVPQGRLFCLDQRTGETLMSVEQPVHIYYSISANSEVGQVKIRMRGRTVELVYGGSDPDGKPSRSGE